MRRSVAVVSFLCLLTSAAFAQSRLDGRWATERSANQQVRLEVTIEDAKASGTLSLGGLGGTFYTFKDGKLTGNRIQFQTDAGPMTPTWTIELVDDDTVTLSRGDLPLVGTNVLDLIAVMGGQNRPAPTLQPAQQTFANASISGVVQDASKALIPGATVTATNVNTNEKMVTTTDGGGRYGFQAVPPGKYTMTVSVSGFQTAILSDLSVGDSPLKKDFTLELPSTQAPANPSATPCGPMVGPNRIARCAVLHRAK